MISSSNPPRYRHGQRSASLPRQVAATALLVCGLLLATPPAEAILYSFATSSSVCFVEEIADPEPGQQITDAAITGSYTWVERESAGATTAAITFVLYDPEDVRVASLPLDLGHREFSLPVVARRGGAYRLCAEVAAAPSAANPIVIDFDVDQSRGNKARAGDRLGGVAQGKELPVREVYDGLEVFTFTDVGGAAKTVLQPRAVLRALEQDLDATQAAIMDVTNNLQTSLNTEGRMRRTSESTFVRVWVCAAVTIAVTVACIWFQFRVLKWTIVKKKLI